MKFKRFCSAKEMVSKLRRPPTEWKKIFAVYTSDNGLIITEYMWISKTKLPPHQ
jgi:hypothetical protein